MMLETELPFWPTVLKSSAMLLPLPHPLVEHKRASVCNMSTCQHVNNNNNNNNKNKNKKLHGPLWPTVLKSSGTLLVTRPHPTPLEQKQACATYMPTTAASEVLKKEHATVTWKKTACLEAPKTSMVRNTH